jgi:hypothetical protein
MGPCDLQATVLDLDRHAIQAELPAILLNPHLAAELTAGKRLLDVW